MTKAHVLLRAAFAVLIASPAFAQDSRPYELDSHVTTESIASPLRFLADDLLEGRGVGTRADALARLYISSELQASGCAPGGPEGSWSQPVPIVAITSAIATPLAAKAASGTASFVAPGDYVGWAYKPAEKTEWKAAELVFVGYGIRAPEQQWDDYKGADLRGKVLLFMNNDPSSDPALFAGKTRLYYGRWSYKFEEAVRQGAAGALIIHTEPSAGYPFQVIQAKHEQEAFWLPFEKDEPMAMAGWVSEDCAKKLAALGGGDLDAMRAAAESRSFKPVPLGVTVDFATTNKVRQIESGNVIGRLEGNDPGLRDEVVTVTAHFDHLGIGPPKKGDAIYNGALDNASGCATMLSLANALSRAGARPRRSLLFIAVTAEESGLIGSAWYARHPTVDPKKIVANFNIDSVNIYGRTRDVQMVGFGKNSLTALAQRVAERRGRKLVPDSEPEKGLFYRSDHLSFAQIGVPSSYFKAGTDFLERADTKRRVQLAYTAVHYHQPSDQFDARWDLGGAVEDAKMLLECVMTAANADSRPTWTAGDEFEKLR